jgi:hypothetical protein
LVEAKRLVTMEQLHKWYHVEKLSFAEIAVKMGLPPTLKSLRLVNHSIDSFKIARRVGKGQGSKLYFQKKRREKVRANGKRNQA